MGRGTGEVRRATKGTTEKWDAASDGQRGTRRGEEWVQGGKKKQERDVHARAKDGDWRSITVDGGVGLRKRPGGAEGTQDGDETE